MLRLLKSKGDLETVTGGGLCQCLRSQNHPLLLLGCLCTCGLSTLCCNARQLDEEQPLVGWRGPPMELPDMNVCWNHCCKGLSEANMCVGTKYSYDGKTYNC